MKTSKKTNKHGTFTPESTNSLAQLSAITGEPIEAIRLNKRRGAPFDLRNRVKISDYKAWCAANPITPAELTALKQSGSLRDEKLIEQIRDLRRINDEADKKLVSAAEVVASWSAQYAFIKKTLIQKLENEYPTAVAGLDVPQARIYGKRLVDEILGQIVKGE